MGRFYQFGEAVLFLFYVNFLWIVFTLLGLFFLGIGPSTVAMFAVFRKWSMGEQGFAVFPVFWKSYREEFLKANGLFWLLFLFGMMLLVNLHYFEVNDPTINLLVKATFILTAILYGLLLLYVFPLYVHYDRSIGQYIKNALLISLYQPLRTMYLLAACFVLYYLWVTFSVFLFLFGPSLTSLVVMWICYRTFIRIEYKQSLLETSKTNGMSEGEILSEK